MGGVIKQAGGGRSAKDSRASEEAYGGETGSLGNVFKVERELLKNEGVPARAERMKVEVKD